MNHKLIFFRLIHNDKKLKKITRTQEITNFFLIYFSDRAACRTLEKISEIGLMF